MTDEILDTHDSEETKPPNTEFLLERAEITLPTKTNLHKEEKKDCNCPYHKSVREANQKKL